MEEQVQMFGYEDQCVLTAGEWYENPWEAEEHAYYQTFNDGDLVCFYVPQDEYDTCYAYFRQEGLSW